MSQLEDDVPPTVEQLHMPSPSLLPVLLAVGLALALVGVTVSIILTIVGLLITIPVIVLWIRAARDETAELPPGH
jgi:Flp pilus assembly protein TadB